MCNFVSVCGADRAGSAEMKCSNKYINALLLPKLRDKQVGSTLGKSGGGLGPWALGEIYDFTVGSDSKSPHESSFADFVRKS